MLLCRSFRVAATLVLAGLVYADGGCAGIDHVNHAGDASTPTGPDVATILLDARLSDGQLCTELGVMRIDPRAADVLILLDRSSSMEAAFGAGSRYQAVAGVLSDLVTAYQNHVRFGYMEMPGRQGCDGQAEGCCVSPPRVELGLGNAAAITSALADAAPLGGGSTPMAAALLAARGYFDGLGYSGADRYVLLATDGAPGCTVSGTLSKGSAASLSACADAKTQVDALVLVGVKVMVLALGSNPASDADSDTPGGACLDLLARAGGAPSSKDGPSYYSAADPGTLSLAIQRIFGALSQPSCFLWLPTVPGDPGKPAVGVYLDGQAIPQSDENGWTWGNSAGEIEITGAYCKQIQQFQVSGFEARYTCPATCIERGGCQSGGPPPS